MGLGPPEQAAARAPGPRGAPGRRHAARCKVDVRIVAATQPGPRGGDRGGRFREDLFYRLDVIPIHIPPLRERPEDIAAAGRGLPAQARRRAGAAGCRPRRSRASPTHALARQRARARERDRARARALRRRRDRARGPAARRAPAATPASGPPKRWFAAGAQRCLSLARARGALHRRDAAPHGRQQGAGGASSASTARRSTAARSARSASPPRSDAMKLGTILVPHDFSSHSEAALKRAIDLAKASKAQDPSAARLRLAGERRDALRHGDAGRRVGRDPRGHHREARGAAQGRRTAGRRGGRRGQLAASGRGDHRGADARCAPT